jgi:hypothetical protein
VDLGISMSGTILGEKLEEAEERGHQIGTWNTRRLPTRLTPGWTNRLFVASGGMWIGYFPLSGDVMWNPEDEQAPYAIIFDPRRWKEIEPQAAPRFRGWRYLDPPICEETEAKKEEDLEDKPPPGRTTSSGS